MFRKKRQTFQWRKAFGLFFFFLSNMSNVRKQIIRVHKVNWQFLCKRLDRFLGPKRSIETNISRNISLFTVTNVFGPLFLVSSSVRNIREQFIRVHKIFHKYFEIYRSSILGSVRLLKTKNFEKKAIFPVMERFWSIPPRIIEHDKPQRTFFKGSQGIVTILVQMIRYRLWHLRRP